MKEACFIKSEIYPLILFNQLILSRSFSQTQELLSTYSDLLLLFAEYSFLFFEKQDSKNLLEHFETMFSTQDPARDGINWWNYCNGNPLKFIDLDGKEASTHDRITKAVLDNLNFISSDSMACDKFVTKVLSDSNVLPMNWPDPNWTNVKEYRNFMKNDLKDVAEYGWNIAVMISDHPTLEDIYGRTLETDPTPHLGLVNKKEDGSMMLVHYTHGEVRIQNFKNEKDFLERMPFEVYVYDTAEYKSLEKN